MSILWYFTFDLQVRAYGRPLDVVELAKYLSQDTQTSWTVHKMVPHEWKNNDDTDPIMRNFNATKPIQIQR